MHRWISNIIFGSLNERELKRLSPTLAKINSLEASISLLSDNELRANTEKFQDYVKNRQRGIKDEIDQVRQEIEEATSQDTKDKEKEHLKRLHNSIFDEILPEAFATVREAARRTINMRHFDVQIIGGIVLHEGKIAEMATGEGKTLVATLPVYLNGLLGRGVHIVTVNDYLARRDREWMGPVYEFLGLSVGVIQHDMNQQERRLAYNCDITYGTNNEFGFDYLRDNMVIDKEDMVQRELFYAIVDEVDSILIDEARTPLIISGPAEESTDKYYMLDRIIPQLKKGTKDEKTKEETGDYIIDEKARTAYLTEHGEINVARLLGLTDMHTFESMEYKHHVNQALRAHCNFKRDVDYIVKDNQVIIVDEFTGRLMPGRRWSDGLHQAIEAKEGVRIERENQTLATITFQNYFRMYDKLAGMTGTAATEIEEFSRIYKLDVVVIPTNRPLIRTNYPDVVYRSEKEKFNAIVDEIEMHYKNHRPVLVGTISIDKSERLSELLTRRQIRHNVLNAKYHEFEAHIIAQAGSPGTVTIATNMAGRGTDILLGGNPEFRAKDTIARLRAEGKEVPEDECRKIVARFKAEAEEGHRKVVDLGGLHVIGSERHEARRIDNQLRGRAGRQGDPGSSRFYVSLEDDLMRIFASDRVARLINFFKLEEGTPIAEHPIVARSIETAQKRVESHNFEIRRHVLEYDNVMNKQREVIYSVRRLVLESEDLKEHIFTMVKDTVSIALDTYLPSSLHFEEWDYDGLTNWLKSGFLIRLGMDEIKGLGRDEVADYGYNKITSAYIEKEKTLGVEVMKRIGRFVLLQAIDSKWKDHLRNMDELREGIHLRGYGQRDPLVEYQREGYDMFMAMQDSIREEALEYIFKIEAIETEKRRGVFSVQQELIHPEAETMGDIRESISQRQLPEFKPAQPPQIRPDIGPPEPSVKKTPKVGRNNPCPCGSGKKYKRCCGA